MTAPDVEAALREALEPFAAAADAIEDHTDDDVRYDFEGFTKNKKLRAGDFRAARAALAASRTETELNENAFREGYEWGFGDGKHDCPSDGSAAYVAISEMYAMGLKPEYKAVNRLAAETGEPDPFVNDKGERCSVRVCPECWSTDGWDSSAKWCYDCSTKTPPVICDLYARAAPPATTETGT